MEDAQFYDKFFRIKNFITSRLASKQNARRAQMVQDQSEKLSSCRMVAKERWFQEEVLGFIETRKSKLISGLSKGDDFVLGGLKAYDDIANHLRMEIEEAERDG